MEPETYQHPKQPHPEKPLVVYPTESDANPPKNAARALILKLVKGIEDWASQEDGIPDDLWETYAHAKAVLGEPINHDPEA